MRTGVDVGAHIAHKYEVIARIGSGGMANVWLARDVRLGKLWAIKEIKPNVRGSQGELLRQALIDEANFIKRLDHPAIPRIVDMLDEGGAVLVVMDYVDGQSLDVVLRMRQEPFEQADVIRWGIALCDVLEYLHGREPAIVYRDLKPANIIVRDDGSVRLIDFGIAVELRAGEQEQIAPMGTPGYAAPEQLLRECGAAQGQPWHAGDLSPLADIYALGTTLYSLVSGHVPKRVRNEEGELSTSFEMRPIRAWNPQLSEGLERIILRATRADPKERYGSIREMRYDLEHYERLTAEWERAQRAKLAGLRRRVLACLACLVLGVSCLVAGNLSRGRSFAELMHQARTLSVRESEGQASAAETCCLQAQSVNPQSLEPYERLLEIYESDYNFTSREAERWQQATGRLWDVARDGRYAQLCFDAGMCFLGYFGVDVSGGAVGNAGIKSVTQAAPWFERALAVWNEIEADGTAQDGELADKRRVASLYLVVANFYEEVSRAGREGVTASETYQRFWKALSEAVERENDAASEDKSAEGVRARLCQVGSEVLSSTTYLSGCARAGINRAQAHELCHEVRLCASGLASFAATDEYAPVYGPLYAEIESGLALAEQNIQNTYENPVASLTSDKEGVSPR